MNASLETLLRKEVTRKEFLAILGLGIISLLGFSTIWHLLAGGSKPSGSAKDYGSNLYGGK